MRINDVQTGHFNLDLPIPLEMVTSLEVLKGSGSTPIWLGDAIGGVVNVRTEPFEASEVRLLTSFGNFGTNEQHLDCELREHAILGRELGGSRFFGRVYLRSRLPESCLFGSLMHDEVETWDDEFVAGLQRQAVRG